jgi:inorganic pyrophosphatase
VDLWKDIPAGDRPPAVLNAVIEVASGSRDKYEYSSEWEAFVLDRVVPSSVVFPVEYGFVPQTFATDKDPLDIMVLSYENLEVGCVVKVRVIGALFIDDEEGEDTKILSAPLNDLRFEGYKDISDVHPQRLREIQEFFETYKRLEPRKWAKFKCWKNVEGALAVVTESMDRYKKMLKTSRM